MVGFQTYRTSGLVMTPHRKRWPLGSVTFENKHLWTREQLLKAGVDVPPLDRVDPRVLHHVEDLLTKAAECIERGRVVIDEIYSDGSQVVVCGGVVDGPPSENGIYEMHVRALQRDARQELESLAE